MLQILEHTEKRRHSRKFKVSILGTWNFKDTKSVSNERKINPGRRIDCDKDTILDRVFKKKPL